MLHQSSRMTLASDPQSQQQEHKLDAEGKL
jgi:hypothetical protein